METVRMVAETLFKLGKASSFMQPYAASVEPFFWVSALMRESLLNFFFFFNFLFVIPFIMLMSLAYNCLIFHP